MTFTDHLNAVRYASDRANQSGMTHAIVSDRGEIKVVPLVNAIEEQVLEVVHSVTPII